MLANLYFGPSYMGLFYCISFTYFLVKNTKLAFLTLSIVNLYGFLYYFINGLLYVIGNNY